MVVEKVRGRALEVVAFLATREETGDWRRHDCTLEVRRPREAQRAAERKKDMMATRERV